MRIITGVLLLACLGMLWYYFWSARPAWQRDQRTLAWHENYLRVRSGWNEKAGSYYLVSFDSGKTWYHAEATDDESVDEGGYYVAKWGFKNLRPAEQELIANLDAWEQLSDIITKGEKLDLRDPKHKKIMEGAGFTITEKK